jgi:cyanate permease
MGSNNLIVVMMMMVSAGGAMFLALEKPVLALIFFGVALVGLFFAAVRGIRQDNRTQHKQ